MVMQFRSKVVPGESLFKNYDDTFIAQRFPALYDILDDILSVNGSTKVPHAQKYRTYRQTCFMGSIDSFIEAAPQYSSWRRGVMPYAYGYEPSVGFSSIAYNNAVTDLYDQLRGSVDLSVDIAQAGQAKAMVSSLVRALRVYADTFDKMKRLRTKDAANAWLQFQYGWRPLANSIYGTLDQTLKQRSTQRFFKIRAKGFDRDREKRNEYHISSTLPVRTQFDISNRCFIHADFNLSGDHLEALAGYTSLNPVSIAWELMPYSFVIDWAVDVGGYLRNFESALLYGPSFVRGFVVETQLIAGQKVMGGSESVGGIRTSYALVASSRQARKRRTVLDEVPYPMAPQINLNLGLQRLTSAAALCRQKLPSGKGLHW